MKKILTVFTGGTICSAPDGEKRKLSPLLAKRVLLTRFSEGDSLYAKKSDQLFEDSQFSEQTLSENMTLEKWERIILHLNQFSFEDYQGIIVLHGTDTLGFTASLFSFLFSSCSVPVMLVSGNRPPMDERSNANVNFQTAVELILEGIAPNVYVPYRNGDGEVRLYLGSCLMQCENNSEDFRSASEHGVFLTKDKKTMFQRCKELSQKRCAFPFKSQFSSKVNGLLLRPYPGLDYSKINLDSVDAVVHGTYHSGTVCTERNYQEEDYSSYSVLYLAKECEKRGIPLFVAPCRLSSEQYSSVFDFVRNSTGSVPLDMTIESAYGKLLVGLTAGLQGNALVTFMKRETNSENFD